MVIPTLPSDIITNILSRLPSKTLIRFKSVSKQWYSIINSPHFINLHLSQTLISDNYPNLITCKDTLFSSPISDNYPHKNRFVQRILGSINGVLSLFSSSSISDDHTNPNFHFSKLDHHYKHRFFRILGSINGVLCISLSDHRSVVLCNPSTKTHHLIPPFTPSPYTNLQCQEIKESPGHDGNTVNILSNIVVYGFGFDSVTRDYKLVRMIETREDNVTVYRESSVYSLKNDSWKCVNDQTLLGQFFLQKDRVVFVNEVLHFIVVDTTDYKLIKIKCFNLRTETLSIFDLPMVLDDRFSLMMSSYFRELGGCFSVFVNYQKILEGLERADLWVMKEYGNEESWFRLFSISDPAMLYGFSRVRSCVRAVVYSKDKKRVLLEFNNGSSFCWYSWGNNTFERITVHGWPYSDYAEPYKSCFTWTFLDSLVLLGKDKSVGKNRAKEEKKTSNVYDWVNMIVILCY